MAVRTCFLVMVIFLGPSMLWSLNKNLSSEQTSWVHIVASSLAESKSNPYMGLGVIPIPSSRPPPPPTQPCSAARFGLQRSHACACLPHLCATYISSFFFKCALALSGHLRSVSVVHCITMTTWSHCRFTPPDDHLHQYSRSCTMFPGPDSAPGSQLCAEQGARGISHTDSSVHVTGLGPLTRQGCVAVCVCEQAL